MCQEFATLFILFITEKTNSAYADFNYSIQLNIKRSQGHLQSCFGPNQPFFVNYNTSPSLKILLLANTHETIGAPSEWVAKRCNAGIRPKSTPIDLS